MCVISVSTISVLGLKGGQAKTTTVLYGAMALYKMGMSVCIVDTDSEASAMNWSLSGELPFSVFGCESNRIASFVKECASKFDVVLIDCPPNNREVLLLAAMSSDVLLCPVVITGQDINRLFPTLDLCKQVEDLKGQAMTSLLLTRFDRRRKLSKEFLENFSNYPILENKISEKVIYQSEFGFAPSYTLEYSSVFRELLDL